MLEIDKFQTSDCYIISNHIEAVAIQLVENPYKYMKIYLYISKVIQLRN